MHIGYLIGSIFVSLGIAAVCAFLCLVLYRLSEAVRNYRPSSSSRPIRRAVPLAPQTPEEFTEEVKKLTPVECRQCGAPHMPDAPICENCGYAPPISLRTGRRGFTTIRRQLENEQNPPNLPSKRKTS